MNNIGYKISIFFFRDYLKNNPDFSEKAELLCFEGGRKSVKDEEPCTWGFRPTNVYVSRASEYKFDANVYLGIFV